MATKAVGRAAIMTVLTKADRGLGAVVLPVRDGAVAPHSWAVVEG